MLPIGVAGTIAGFPVWVNNGPRQYAHIRMIVGFPSPADGTDFSVSVGSVEGREVAVEKKWLTRPSARPSAFSGPS